jgi:MFS family permease
MLGIMACLLLALPAGLIVRRRPEDVGLLPDGDHDDSVEISKVAQSILDTNLKLAGAEVNWSAKQALITRAFWFVMVSLILTALTIMGVWLHAAASFTDQGISPAQAALAMASVAITSVPARLFWGLLAERLHIRYCTIIVYVGLAASVILVMVAAGFLLALVAMLSFGAFVGGGIVLQAMVWPEYFGRLALGRIQGYSELFRVGGVAGAPIFAGFFYDLTGSYYPAFISFAAGCLLAALMMYFAKPPIPPADSPARA